MDRALNPAAAASANTPPDGRADTGLTLEQRIEIDRVRALWATAPTSSVIGTISAILWFVVFYPQVGAATMGLLSALVFANQVVRVLLARRYAREPDDPARATVWADRYTWTMIAGGLLWGALSMYLFRPDDTGRQIILLVAAYGITSGATAPNAYHLPAMFWYIGTTLTPIIVRVLLEGGLVYGYLAFILSMQVVFMILFGLGMHKQLLASIRMRHENARLLGALQHKTEALERASQAKAQFFASASHDLRQPLHALGYYASLLKSKSQTPESVHVDRIEQCVHSLENLIDGVLDLSRLDAGRVSPEFAPVHVGALLTRVAALYDAAAHAGGLQLRVRARPMWARSDPILLERVLTNLVSNALRYTPRGGVLLAVRRRGHTLRLQVFDTGIGIADSERSRIFDEFVQLNNQARNPSRGVGLGLATVKRLCALLDHPLELRSVPGRGSCFELQLTAIEPPVQAASSSTSAKPTIDAMTGRVLVVDDHALVRESLLETLRGWGLACDGVEDGPAALALAARSPYHVVLCDWRLPGSMNGTETLLALNEIHHGQVLLVLVTGETDQSIGEVPDCIHVLRKPIRPIRLRALLGARLQPQAPGTAGPGAVPA